MTFLIHRVQPLQHRWKKCVNRKGDYVEKETSFGLNPWEYLG